jgi:hypothetical protein
LLELISIEESFSFVYNNEILSLVLHVTFYHNYKISYTLDEYGKIARDMRTYAKICGNCTVKIIIK